MVYELERLPVVPKGSVFFSNPQIYKAFSHETVQGLCSASFLLNPHAPPGYPPKEEGAMRFLVPIIVLAALVTLSSGAGARTVAADEESSAARSTELSGSGRIGGDVTTTPQWFGGRWWKKFKRAFERFLEFIDGLIDDLRNQPGDEPKYGWRPAIEERLDAPAVWRLVV
jgi:hypothetical protein